MPLGWWGQAGFTDELVRQQWPCMCMMDSDQHAGFSRLTACYKRPQKLPTQTQAHKLLGLISIRSSTCNKQVETVEAVLQTMVAASCSSCTVLLHDKGNRYCQLVQRHNSLWLTTTCALILAAQQGLALVVQQLSRLCFACEALSLQYLSWPPQVHNCLLPQYLVEEAL